jgi:hypothetical protein
VEAWTGTLEHLESHLVDASVVRNVPESNSSGSIELPRTGVRRAFTAIPVDAAKGGAAEIAWDGAEGLRSLRLTFAPATPVRDLERPDGSRTAAVRIGATGAALEQDVRPGSVDATIDRVRADLSSMAELVDQTSFNPVTDGGILLVSGPAKVVEGTHAAIRAAETRLSRWGLDLRAVALPEASLREGFESGTLAVGAALPPKVASDLDASGVVVASVRLPVCSGVRASLRAGASEASLSYVESEVAQKSGGIAPVAVARFAGLAGAAGVVEGADGTAILTFDGALSWTRWDGSSVEVAFRSPVGMAFNRDATKPEDSSVRRAKLPIGTYGDAKTNATATLSPADVTEGRPVLLAVLPRGGGEGLPDTVLLVARVQR